MIASDSPKKAQAGTGVGVQADAKAPPLIILGIDAGDPVFIRRWAAQGYLPAIASIMERGCWARTAGPELISEHGVWMSLFSGLSRSQHGYYYFRQLNPGTYDLMLLSGPDINAPPLLVCSTRPEEEKGGHHRCARCYTQTRPARYTTGQLGYPQQLGP